MAGGAASLEGRRQWRVERAVEVEPRDPGDRERPRVEDRLAASDCAARFVDATAGAIAPNIVNVEDERSEGRSRAIVAEIVVDAVVRGLRSEERRGGKGERYRVAR